MTGILCYSVVIPRNRAKGKIAPLSLYDEECGSEWYFDDPLYLGMSGTRNCNRLSGNEGDDGINDHPYTIQRGIEGGWEIAVA